MLQNLFKHSSLYLIGSFISKSATTLAWILLARALQPTLYGQFTLFFLLIQTITFFFDFGLIQFFFKHVEKGKEEILFGKLIYLRTLQLIISIVFAGLLLSIFKPFLPVTSFLMLLTLIPMAYLSIAECYYLEKKQPFKVSLKLGSIGFFFLLLFFLLSQGFSFSDATIVFFASTAITLLWFFPWRTLKKVTVIPVGEITTIWQKSFPFALLTFISYVYNRADSFIIAAFRGPLGLGIYGLAYRFLDALSMVPTSLSQNLFPVTAKKTGVSKNNLTFITIGITIFGAIIGISLFLSSDFIIQFTFGEAYRESAEVLKVFSIVITLMFINSPLSTVVQSSKLLHRFLPFGIANTLFNIVLNLVFVPTFGIMAAAWMMVISEALGLLINLFFIRKLYKYDLSIDR